MIRRVSPVIGIVIMVALLAPPLSAADGRVGPVFDPTPPRPLSVDEALAAFRIEDGLSIEVVASEPLIAAPVALSFDDQGRLYVVEMRGYMNDVAGTGEDQPSGRVSLLSDSDGDGRMDQSTVFLDGLVLPRAVMAVAGGVLIGAPPKLLFARDTDGDGRADVVDTVATDVGSRGNPEHQPNAPTWMMDNWIWLAECPHRFRWRSGRWERDRGLGRGQWGLTQDDRGRVFYNYNQDILRCDLLPAEWFLNHPRLSRSATSLNHATMTSRTVWPGHPTPSATGRRNPTVVFRPDGSLKAADATCAPLIYRGDALPQFRGQAFVCEPVGNLVKRLLLREQDGIVTADHSVQGREFLISTDERFRPVFTATGPDGALYVVDMYRGVIEHRAFMNDVLAADAKARQLETPLDRGRIWRVVNRGTRPAPYRLPTTLSGRVAALSHANGWVRDTAQRLLVESADPAAVPALVARFHDTDADATTRLHVWWTVVGLGAVPLTLAQSALGDADAAVRAAAVRKAPVELLARILPLANDRDVLVRAAVAARLAALGGATCDQVLIDLLLRDGERLLVREAALSGLDGRELELVRQLLLQPDTAGGSPQLVPVIAALAQQIGLAAQPTTLHAALELGAHLTPGSARQLALLGGLAGGEGGKATALPARVLTLPREPMGLLPLQARLPDNLAIQRILARVNWPGREERVTSALVVPLTEVQEERRRRGEVLYASVCAACHQPHGRGLDGLAPPLVDSPRVTGRPDVAIRIVLHGLTGPVVVGDRSWNLTMPPLAQFNDEDIADVLTYVRRAWDLGASPVEAAQVQEVRARYAGRTAPWSVSDLGVP
jgi:mono/diheme cytochrome c family protein/glucose/arabinose dehydrogenase